MRTPLCDLLGIEYPILQAGMGIYRGLVTTPELVAAVSNAGGMGCIGAMGVEPEDLRKTIRAVRRLTDKPFGVDLLIPARMSTQVGSRVDIRADIANQFPGHQRFADSLFTKFGVPRVEIDSQYTITSELTDAQAEVVFEEQVPVLVIGLGDPAPLMPRARLAGIKVAGLAGSLANARRQLAANVDFLICQGSEAGGHVGTIGTFALLPQVIGAAGGTPVVAAGGIATGAAIAAALAFGAQGVWCGTVFLFSDEANVHPTHREQLIEGRSEDFVASRVFTGKPSRMFRSETHKEWEAAGIEPLQMPHQKVLMDDFAHSARRAGRPELVANPAGQIAGLLNDIRPAADIVSSMIEEARQVIRRCAASMM